MTTKLTILSDNRLENPGKCETCKFSSHWLEYGSWNWDCTHKHFDKLPECDEEENSYEWGSEDNCILWEPITYVKCDKHDWYPEVRGCPDCEAEYIMSLEKLEEYVPNE